MIIKAIREIEIFPSMKNHRLTIGSTKGSYFHLWIIYMLPLGVALSGPIYAILGYNVFVVLYSMVFLKDIESEILVYKLSHSLDRIFLRKVFLMDETHVEIGILFEKNKSLIS